MSFDLFVWHEESPITADEAGATVDRFIADPSAVDAHPGVLAFHAALLGRFPALESFSDDDFETLGVWSVSPEASDRLVALNIAWSHTDQVASAVKELAREHGLICFDPQIMVVWPNAAGSRPAFVFQSQTGPTIPEPSADRIRSELTRVGRANEYAILDRNDEWYVQVGYGKRGGVRPGTYVMEYREGSADRHFRSETTDIEAVIRFMQEFLRGEDTWKSRHSWHRINA